MRVDFSRRNHLAEIMDAEGGSFDAFRAYLEDLAFVNEVTLGYRPTLNFFTRLLASGRLPKHRPIIVVDAGSGYGDMARKLDRWARRREIQLEIIGVDRNPWSTKAATGATRAGRPIRFITGDILSFAQEPRPDVVISSLFAHHLDEQSLVAFLRWMEANAALGWFINDLHRHWLPFHAFRILSPAMRIHESVQYDGPISIARAFQIADWERQVDAAGIPRADVTVEWSFPFRLCVERIKHR